jgi:hypothetical protein
MGGKHFPLFLTDRTSLCDAAPGLADFAFFHSAVLLSCRKIPRGLYDAVCARSDSPAVSEHCSGVYEQSCFISFLFATGRSVSA